MLLDSNIQGTQEWLFVAQKHTKDNFEGVLGEIEELLEDCELTKQF